MTKPKTQITDFKITVWENSETAHKLYGVSVYLVGTGWAYLEEDKIPIIVYSRAAAQKEISKMKSKLTRSGYRKAA